MSSEFLHACLLTKWRTICLSSPIHVDLYCSVLLLGLNDFPLNIQYKSPSTFSIAYSYVFSAVEAPSSPTAVVAAALRGVSVLCCRSMLPAVRSGRRRGRRLGVGFGAWPSVDNPALSSGLRARLDIGRSSPSTALDDAVVQCALAACDAGHWPRGSSTLWSGGALRSRSLREYRMDQRSRNCGSCTSGISLRLMAIVLPEDLGRKRVIPDIR